MVEPDPMNGSATTPVPSGSDAKTIRLRKDCGLMLGCPAMARSRCGVPLAGDDILEGQAVGVAAQTAVSNLRRQSLTFIFGDRGFRKTPQGS